MECDIAPRSMPRTMVMMLGSNPGLRRFFYVRRFLTVYGSRFALKGSGGSCGGLVICLHLVGGSRAPNGIASGWDQVRAGSGEQSRGLFCFSSFYMKHSQKFIYQQH